MKQAFYQLIYTPKINNFLRNINKILYPILPKSIRIAPSGIITIRHSGNILKINTNQTNYLTFLVFWEGYKYWEYTDIFIHLIKKMNSFFDIGANIGYYSLLAAMENSKIEIVSFEPATGPLFYFKKNIELNNYSNIKLEAVALSHKSGEIDFYEIKNKKYTYLEHNLAGEGNAGSITTGRNFVINKVPTITLDDYVKTNHIKYIDLIKIDTEGTENLILENSKFVLEEMKPIVICETLFQTIESELEIIMNIYGYEFYNHTERGLKKVTSIKRELDNGVRNCFFVHPSKYYLITEFIDK